MTTPREADRLLELEGTVQGVGFRPFVARLAARFGIRGWVRNDAAGATLRVVAMPAIITTFCERLLAELPAAARVETLRDCDASALDGLPAAPEVGFVILESVNDHGPRRAAITPDLAICPDCRRELATPDDRRHAYPFINCTQCGPRFSIIESLPYDRPRTTMAGFAMCSACAREYLDPTDRRYHAQPNACAACGPHVILLVGNESRASRAAAIAAAAAALRDGRIVAVKGIGGFHLMCDAANEKSVQALRQRKHRDEKPFAVMFPSLDALRAVAEVNDDAARALAAPAAPIVLVRRKPDAPIAAGVAPGNPFVGALLPYSPLHILLLEAVGRPLVATSGNLAEEPLCTDNDEARERLGSIADAFLVHNRPIARAIDDSVVRPSVGGNVCLRRARGFAPRPLRLPTDAIHADALLAVGGHHKATIALTTGTNVVLSPHLGDLGNPVAMAAFRHAVELFQSLHAQPVTLVACDAHPDYASTHFATALGLPVLRVQHHLAHILACLLEHDGGPTRVLGVAWDGAGYGSDGTVWGGEFIVVDRAAKTARRVAHLRPFRLPGGDAAAREPRRSALGVCHEFVVADEAFERIAARFGFRTSESATLRTLLRHGTHAPITTSAGRLFDAAAALLGIRTLSSFEGQAAMELEFAAGNVAAPTKPIPMPVTPNARGVLELDWRPLVRELIQPAKTADPALLAAQFHATLAAGITSVARACAIDTVILTGGCFQNVRLLEQTTRALTAANFAVLRHRELPPNDGGLAAGQALGARWGISSVAV